MVVDPLKHLGRAEGPTFIEIVDVQPAGRHVYACTGTKGLTIYDTSGGGAARTLRDRIAPTAVGLADPSFPRCQHIGLDPAAGRIAITNRGDEIQPRSWVWVFDVANPADPKPVGGWTPDGSVEGVVLDGARLYLAMHGDGVFIVEQSGGSFTGIGSFADDESDAWLPVLVGDTLIVAEGATGLRTYDVSGAEPVLLATLPLAGSSRDVVIDGGVAYVATSGGLASVDIADPAAPRLLGEIEVAGTALEVALAADDVLVTAQWDQVRGYDISDPSSMRSLFGEVVPSDDIRSRILAVGADPERRRVYAGEWRGMHTYEQSAGGSAPDIFVTPGALQFGTVNSGETREAVIVLRNEGDKTLTVTDIIGGPGLTSDTQCLQVEPRAAEAIEVRFESAASDVFGSGIKVCSDDPDEGEHVIDVTANVPGTDVGSRVPAFELADTTGQIWSPDRLEGNIAVLAYFATF